VNTLPSETLEAYRDQGQPALRLGQELLLASELPSKLSRHGIDLVALALQLEIEGVKKFVDPFDKLLSSLERRRRQSVAAGT
jgi:transaldolase